MSNQRRGKWKPASMGQDSFRTITFFKEGQRLLEEYGHEDAAYYFEQVEEHLRGGNGLPSSEREIGKVLGV